jgi:hypothetical protein
MKENELNLNNVLVMNLSTNKSTSTQTWNMMDKWILIFCAFRDMTSIQLPNTNCLSAIARL